MKFDLNQCDFNTENDVNSSANMGCCVVFAIFAKLLFRIYIAFLIKKNFLNFLLQMKVITLLNIQIL